MTIAVDLGRKATKTNKQNKVTRPERQSRSSMNAKILILMHIFRYITRISYLIWTSTRENRSSWSANNKGADQPAHPRRLISAYVIRFLGSFISELAISDFSIF